MAHDAAQGTLEVVHRIPGRLRVRVPPTVRAADLSDAVAALTGVTSVTWSPRTRSLLVLYERERADDSAIVAAFAQHAQLDVAPSPHAGANGQRPTLAAAATSLFGEVNARVARASGGALSLGVLVPAALTLWAARELLRGRAAPLAWSSALWYAHGLFRDYALPSRED
jgi:hypothetical protein